MASFLLTHKILVKQRAEIERRPRLTDCQRAGGTKGQRTSGGREPEGAGPSPLNSVFDSNMCLIENIHFVYLSNQCFCLSPRVGEFLYLFPIFSSRFPLPLSSFLDASSHLSHLYMRICPKMLEDASLAAGPCFNNRGKTIFPLFEDFLTIFFSWKLFAP